MTRNTHEESTHHSEADVAHVLVRWSERSIGPAPSVASFSSTAGDRWLAFAADAADDPAPAGRRDGWIPFSLRMVYPGPEATRIADAPYLLVVRVVAEGADRDEFRRWLDEEHCRLQVSLPGVNWFRGYEEEGPHHSFLNVWSVDDPAIVNGEAWEQIRDTPWWARVKHVPAGADRDVYRRDADPAD